MLATEQAVQRDGAAAPLAAVVRLWLLAEPQERETLDAALPGIGVEGLLELGLLRPVPGTSLFTAKADLRPYGWDANPDGSGGAELWVASDLAAHQQAGVLRHDHVLGIGQASTTLVQTTIRRHTERALDLGTGCGIQAFHLLHHCQHVTGTDISERALAYARFNILLNAEALSVDPDRLEDRVSLRLGSMLEPVAGEEFGLVVSNPPFVITPRSAGEDAAGQFTYRDGGLPGDEIVASLVAELPGILAPGGAAQMLGNWEVPDGAGWDERPQSPGCGPVPMPGSSSASRSARNSTPKPGCRTPPNPGTGSTTGTPTPRTLRISSPGTSRGSASAWCGCGGPLRARAGCDQPLRGNHLPHRAAHRAPPGCRRRTQRLAGRARSCRHAPARGRRRHGGAPPAPRRRAPGRDPAPAGRRAAPHQPDEHRAGRVRVHVRRRPGRRADRRRFGGPPGRRRRVIPAARCLPTWPTWCGTGSLFRPRFRPNSKPPYPFGKAPSFPHECARFPKIW